MTIGTRIRALRVERGITQVALASAAGVTPANLSAIESSRRDLLVGTLSRIAGALAVPPHELLAPPPRTRTSLPHDAFNRVARAALSGERELGTELNRLADAVAWHCRPLLDAAGAAGRRRNSRRAARIAPLAWDRELVKLLVGRVHKLAASTASESR